MFRLGADLKVYAPEDLRPLHSQPPDQLACPVSGAKSVAEF